MAPRTGSPHASRYPAHFSRGRRTCNTNLEDKGIGVRVPAELAAHSSIATTQRYIDVNDEQLRAGVELA